MKKLKLLITICFLVVAYQGQATPKNEHYQRRKKRAVQQLDSLILVNQANKAKGLVHQNWYIFSDTDPITEVGLRFFFKDRRILEVLNAKIRKFNQENGFEFYVKLSGLRALEYDKIKEIFGLGLFNKIFGEEKPSDTPLARMIAQGLNDYYQKINKATEIQLKKAQKEELELSSDVYSTSKLGKYGAILSVTKYYFYHFLKDKAGNITNKQKLYAKFAKSLAIGSGFNEAFMEFLEEDEYYDAYRQKVKNLAFSMNKIALEYQQGNRKTGNFLFALGVDEALKNHVEVVTVFLKNAKQVNTKGGYNVVYLVNVTGNFKGLSAAQTQEELRKITIQANQYFQTLKVKTRCALYSGKPEDFRFDLLGLREGVVFIGGHSANDASDMIDAIAGLANPKTDSPHKEYEANRVFSDSLRQGFKVNYYNPEKSSVFQTYGYNRIAIHYERSKSPAVVAQYKAAKVGAKISGGFRETVVDPAEVHIAHIRVSAYSLVHGVGHNAELSWKNGRLNPRWNHYGGVMADGNQLDLAGSLTQRLQPNYLRQYVLKNNKINNEVWISTQDNEEIKDLTKEKALNIKEVYTYKELEHKTILSTRQDHDSYNGEDSREIVFRDFVFDQKFIQSANYHKFLLQHPRIAPNHTYKYSLEQHFGNTKAKANSSLGKIILK